MEVRKNNNNQWFPDKIYSIPSSSSHCIPNPTSMKNKVIAFVTKEQREENKIKKSNSR